MLALYPKGSLEDLMLRGWLFQEAVRLCNLGRQSKSDRRAVYDILSTVDSAEYRALWAAANLSENKILELLGRWGEGKIEPSEFLGAMGFCPRTTLSWLMPDEFFDAMGYGSEWAVAKEARRIKHNENISIGRRRGMAMTRGQGV